MIDDDLAFLGAPRNVRDALAILPPAFASAFVADARRIVENESLPVRPTVPEDYYLPPPPNPYGIASPDGMEHPAVLRFLIVRDLMRFDAGRLLAFCNAFRSMLAAWKADRGRDLEPDGPDCPPLASREWTPRPDD